MLSIHPYLHFMGNTEVAMNYYKSILGGEFAIFSRFKDVPGGEKMAAEDQEKMMHISLVIGDTTIMATDALESMGQKTVAGNNFQLCLNVRSEAEADQFFAGLSKEGKVEMPMNKTFWGAYFGMCQDQFGVHWMINFDTKK